MPNDNKVPQNKNDIGDIIKLIISNKHMWFVLLLVCGVVGMVSFIGSFIESKEINNITNSDIISREFISTIWLLLVIIAICALGAYLANRNKSNKEEYKINRHLIYGFTITWIMGFITYCVGTYSEVDGGDGFSNFLSVVPMAMIHATEMFLGQSDISAIHSHQHENTFFMLLFNISHFLAILCSLYFIIQQFGFYLIGEMRMWFESKMCVSANRNPKNLFVFWGLNERSFILAESIGKEFGGKEYGSKMVFVRTFDDEDSQSSHVGFNRIFSMVKLKNKEIEKLRRLNCLVTTSFRQLSKAEISAISESDTEEEKRQKADRNKLLANHLNLASLVRLIESTQEHVHIFMLNEDEDLNIKCTNNIIGDEDIKRLVAENKKIHIHCHARHSAKTRGLEVENILKYDDSLQIDIIDSSELAVFSLKDNPAYHPVRFVDVDDNACVTSPFHAVIIGFGETGQEAFKFLYEFGAFVRPDGEKSEYRCTVIDNKANKLKGLLYAHAPMLVEKGEHRFCNCDIDSSRYWKIIKDEVENGLNNLFVTIDNDDLAIETVVNFCNLAVRWTSKEQKLYVYIRCYRQDNYEKQKTVIDRLNGKYGNINIVLFGEMNSIFTYDIIVNKRYEQDAKSYNHAYSGFTPADIDECWKDKLKISRTIGNPAIWNVEDTERRRDQNFSNAMHADTKMYLLTASTGRNKDYWQALDLSRAEKTPHYLYIGDTDADILLNVAKCEHERWIAASILQGQTLTDAHEPNVQRKHHTDLVPWNEIRKWDRDLQLEVQAYDCDVVDTTIKLSKNK